MKHLHKKNISKAVLSLVVTVVLFVLCSLNVFAAQNYDGGVGVGGGGSSALAGGTYSIGTGFSSKVYDKPILGLRFSVYNKETDTTYGSVDIYRSSCSNISNFVNRNKATVKYNHKQLEKSWTSIGLYWTTSQTFSYDNYIGVSLPATTSGIEEWQWNYNNTSKVLQHISGAPSHILNFQYGDRLLIEPIYPLEVGGSTYVLTVAEIAVLGAKTYGTGAISAKTNSNTWNFIAYHTNMYFPGSLMTTSGDSGLYAATSQPTSCIPFPNILTGGYGLSVVWKTDEAVSKYTVTYDANGGTGAPGNQTFTVDDWGNLSTQIPTREGYRFVGWQDHNDYTYNGTAYPWYAFDAPFYANTYGDVLYHYGYDKHGLISHWVDNYVVNGIAGGHKYSSQLFYLQHYYNANFEEFKPYYGYNKWLYVKHWIDYGYNEGRQGTDVIINDNNDVYPAGANVRRLGTDGQTVVLTAKWEPITYTITYDANGGTGAPGNQTECIGEWGKLSDQIPTREGYKFIGWQDHNDYTYNGTAYPWYAFDAPFYANTYGDVLAYYGYDKHGLISHWVDNFVIQGLPDGGHKYSSQFFYLQHYYNANFEEFRPILGYSKLQYVKHWIDYGYNEGRQGTDVIINDNNDVYPAGANVRRLGTEGQTVVLTAKWEPITYTITYDANGGTGAPGNQTFIFGQAGTLSTQIPTKPGYTFIGWQDHNDFTYTDGFTYPWYTFNAPFYANTYGDIFNYYGYDKYGLISHWVGYYVYGGYTSGHRYSSEVFNLLWYKEHGGQDLINAYGTDTFKYMKHWTNWGYAEGRKGVETVDTSNKDVYPSGATVKNLTLTNGATITLTAKWEKISQQTNLILVPLEPNAPYREDTEVVTSYWIVNPSDKDYTPSDNIKVEFTVYNANGTVIKTALKQTVVPARDKNLVYFKWQVPTGLNYEDVTVNSEINDGNTNYGLTSNTYATTPYTYFTTPDTKYEPRAPIGFSVKRSPGSSLLQAKWWEWTYNGGVFKKVNYAIGNKINIPTVSAPTSKSAKFSDGKLVIRSGYGFDCSFTCSVFTDEEYQTPNSGSFTASQYSYALFPEFSYKFKNGYARTFENVSGVMKFYNSDNRADRHYTPIYFPDGSYYFNIVASDSWTPAGMITTAEDVEIGIDGNMYDDWYITHNLP